MPSRTKTHIRERTCAHIQHQSHTNTHTSERCVEFQLPDGGDCLYELASNCVADLCKNSLWSQIHRGERDGENERNRERKTEQRGWKKRDWNILCVKIELENEGHRHPPLQHLLLSSRLSFFGFHLYRCCLFKMKLTDSFITIHT